MLENLFFKNIVIRIYLNFIFFSMVTQLTLIVQWSKNFMISTYAQIYFMTSKYAKALIGDSVYTHINLEI